MRIRKRFPMSSMSSPVSDPHLHSSTLVQQTSPPLHPIQNTPIQHDSQPSDPPNRPLSSDQTPAINKNSLHPNKFEIKHKEEEEEENGSNNTRKEYDFLAVEPVGETRVLPSLISSHPVGGRWFEGDEKMPLKKRKGVVEEEETVALKMKSKTNKKCSTSGMQQNQDKVGNGEINSSSPSNNVVKKMNKRGGAIMEGSRCSRVNGRGWRCCQQTLVGYSLCEHHLGKGRLRSISNVKGRKAPTVASPTIAPQNVTTNDSTSNANTTSDNEPSKKVSVSSSVVQSPRDRKSTILLDGSCYDDDEDEDEDKDEDEDDDDYNEDETKKPVAAKKKRMKIGMVKARSLSSLLNQTN